MGYLTEEPRARIGGFDFYSSKNLLIRDKDKKVKKTFRERLTWKFWEKYKLVSNMIPDPAIYRLGNRVIGHTIVITELIKKLESRYENEK